jgi:PST family polysaccharide transporter
LAAVTADWVVQILLGPTWLQAIPLVALFSVSATYLPVLLAAFLLFLTQARTVQMLRATLIDACLCVISIVIGLQWGANGVAAALAVVGLTIRMPVAFWLATRQGPVRVADIWRAIAPPASAAVAVAAAVFLVRRFEPDPTAAGIAAVGATALVVVLLTLLAWPETRRELIALMSLRLRRPRPT